MKQKRKLGRKLLSFLLTLAMVIGLMPGMSLTAFADGVGVKTFTATSSSDGLDTWDYIITTTDCNIIRKIEILVDMENIVEGGWGQVKWAYNSDTGATETIDNKPGIRKYTVEHDVISDANNAIVQIVGSARLLAYTVTYNGTTSLTAGDWDIPTLTVPTAKTELTYNGKQQELVNTGIVATGGAIEYSTDKSTWSTEAPKGMEAKEYTVYYRVNYGNNSTYTPLQGNTGITVTINKANAVAATVTANNRTYDGTDKPLVTVDNATLDGGTMWYALSKNATTAPEEKLYTTSIPTATNAGTYYVWYKVVGDSNHSDTEAAFLEVKIEKQKETEKQTEKETEKQTEKETEKQTEKETEKETEKQTEKETEKQQENNTVPYNSTYTPAPPMSSTPANSLTDSAKVLGEYEEPTGATIGILKAQEYEAKNNSITIGWKEIPGAVGYAIYGAQAGMPYQKLADVAGMSFKQEGLVKGTSYKYFVAAYDANGNILAVSKTIHVSANKNNPKSVKINKKKASLSTGGTFKIKASVKGGKGKLRYESSNPAVATVSSNGTVTAVSPGKCTIYVFAQNGKYKTCKITVK